jgi:hypothetical protein
VNFLGWYAIPTDVFVDRLAMFLIVTQGIEDLGQCEVRETSDDFFWGDAELPELRDGAHRVRLPDTMGAPWRISSVQTMYGWLVATVMLKAYWSHGGKSILSCSCVASTFS